MYGTNERLIKICRSNSNYLVSYEGVVHYIEMQQDDDASASAQKWADQFTTTSLCPECNGQRLNKEALHFLINGKNIAELANMDIFSLREWIVQSESVITKRQDYWRGD